MIELYIGIWLVGLIMLLIFAALGGFGMDADAGDVDVDFDVDVDADADFDLDAGDTDMDLDVDGDAGVAGHPSAMSLPIILTWLTSFGAIGMILEAFETNWIYVPIIAAIISIGIALLVFFIMVRVFSSTQATSVVPLKKVIGLKASVTVMIKKGMEGQVMVEPPNRGRLLIGAIADTNIKPNTVVEIVEVVGGVVKVRKAKTGKKRQAVMK